MDTQGKRVRVNAKSTSKGEYYFDATFEDTAVEANVDAAADTVLKAIEALETQFAASGKKIAGAA